MMALFPPNSRIVLPNLSATVFDTWRPIRVDPVKETIGTRLSLFNKSPEAFPITRFETPSGILLFFNTSRMMFWQAIAQSGVFEDGFQIQTSPQTHAIMEFHDQTATGKLNAEMIPTIPSGCHCSYIR